MSGEHDDTGIVVAASPEEVLAILREEFSEEQLAGMTISESVEPEDDLLGPRRGIDPVSVIQWAGLAIAGNAAYDLSKAATLLLIARLGASRIFKRPQA